MTINLAEIMRQMTANAEAIRSLVQAFPSEQTQWKPDPETWSMKDVMEHLYNEERMDFRRHLKEMFRDPSQPVEYAPVEACNQALEGFLQEREASIAWLSALQTPDWNANKRLIFSPSESITISAEEMLISWVEHDFLHVRQMVELLHEWNAQRATHLALEYAGGW
jgi:hypothetical protein